MSVINQSLGIVKAATWYSGTADSDSAIKQQVTAPLDGDFYFSETSGNVWKYTERGGGGIWSNISNLKGLQGAKGDTGTAATVSVGTVTTGAAGSQASVTNVGNANAAVLNFSIPKGDKGDKGERGPQGEIGPQGPQGEIGPQGPAGPAATTDQILNLVYPVGSIYMSVNNVSPQIFIGGTWVAWGAGCVPVSVDTTDSDFNTVEKTGGAKTVALTTNEMPGHTHSCAQALTQTSTANQIGLNYSDVSTSGYFSRSRSSNNYGSTNSGTRKTNLIGNFSHSHTMGTTGRGFAHNNLQPYITCYMWKRTA